MNSGDAFPPSFLDRINPFSKYRLEKTNRELTANCEAQSISGDCGGLGITREMADTFSKVTAGTLGAVAPGESVVFAGELVAIRAASSVAKNLGSFADESKLLGHFIKHGAEFGVKNPEAYLALAREVMANGIKVSYKYKDEIRTGFVQFMKTNRKGQSQFAFVGTNNRGYITTLHIKSGKDFWKTLNGNAKDKTINAVQ